jgi:hypothetical protein
MIPLLLLRPLQLTATTTFSANCEGAIFLQFFFFFFFVFVQCLTRLTLKTNIIATTTTAAAAAAAAAAADNAVAFHIGLFAGLLLVVLLRLLHLLHLLLYFHLLLTGRFFHHLVLARLLPFAHLFSLPPQPSLWFQKKKVKSDSRWNESEK